LVAGGETAFVALCSTAGGVELRKVTETFVGLSHKTIAEAVSGVGGGGGVEMLGGVSVGVAVYPEDATSVEMFLRVAQDNALRAKLSGGSRVV
jgi:GGDEF domain-containing protein